MRRLVSAAVAWLVGGAIYVFGSFSWNGYDGFPDAVLLPIMAGLVSSVVVAGCVGVGAVLRYTRLRRVWNGPTAAAVSLGSVAALAFGPAIGLTAEFSHPETGESFIALHPLAAVGAYFGLVFALANWPPLTPSASPVGGSP